MKSSNFLKYQRRKTIQVHIGGLELGSDFPIRLQSMTNTDTSDADATVKQIIAIADAGADLVRVTVPTSSVAEKLADIKSELKKRGYTIPIVADIHFSPKAAVVSARYVEKVRINPGNYADKKQFKHIDYTDESYNSEVEGLKENFVPFLEICKTHNTSIRIGTNHGSLSDRILSRYGDTPLGMVESTMEFLRICKEERFNDVVISMKASNPIIMIRATRLLAKTMTDEDMYFPIHLGVTEAGNDTEGRIKSAVGIGSLLADGIGDTIRVSLTEAPEKEIPVAASLVEIMHANKLSRYSGTINTESITFDPYSYKKRNSKAVGNIGGDNVPVVISDIGGKLTNHALLQSGYLYDDKHNKFTGKDDTADYLFVDSIDLKTKTDEKIKLITNKTAERTESSNVFFLGDHTDEPGSDIRFVTVDASDIADFVPEKYRDHKSVVFVLSLDSSDSPIHAGRQFFLLTDQFGIDAPVILKQSVQNYNEHAIIKASAELGSLFTDGFGDGIWLRATNEKDIRSVNQLAFGILQACRMRITQTEYISCPSCGRTLFNLEETTAKIKVKTAHLKGLKIGIMGCIVNGPGEMADADFGYVGTGSGKITLYKQKEVIKRNIPEENAVEELLKLIEQYY
jgi:(E)-4-hydroxy-3-methylbut-2-enyl-diphosphate synthase